MQKKLFRKIVAGALSVAMLLGMTAVSFAATEGSETGTGTSEGYVSNEVVSVDLPTNAEGVFDYKMDPAQLIAQTENALYEDEEFEEGATVYFQDADGNWKSKSRLVTVKNTGTVDIDVEMSAKLDAVPSEYTMADDADFGTSTAAELYLGLFVDGKDTEKAIKDGTGDSITYGVAGNEDNYQITTSGTEYVFSAIAGQTDWSSVSFGLTGACNTNEGTDWSDLEKGTDGAADVIVTWKYEQRGDNSQAELIDNAVAGPSISISETGLITASRIDDANNPVVWDEFVVSDGDNSWAYTQYPELFTLTNTDNWENGVGGEFEIQLNEGAVNGLKGKTATITTKLQDGTVLTDSVVIK